MAVWTIVAYTTVFLVALGCDAPQPRPAPKQAERHSMSEKITDPQAARRMAFEQADAILPGVRQLRLTLPMPAHWPSAGRAQVVYFAYRLHGPLSSRGTSGVMSPAVRIAVRVDSSQPVLGGHRRLQESDLGTQVEDVEPVSQARIDEAVEALFRAVVTQSPAEDDLRIVRTIYRRWRQGNDTICADLQRRLPAFFQWLDEPGPSGSK
jgi:hypothetical protein